MLMLGNMSVGVCSAEATPKIMISSAITTKVYGRRSASLTMPTMCSSSWTGGLLRQALGLVLQTGQNRRKDQSGSAVSCRCAIEVCGMASIACGPREEPGDDIRAAQANVGE